MAKEGSLKPRWHLSRGGKQHGPFSDQELLHFAHSGKLRANDLLWRPGFETWRAISSVPGLLTPPGLGTEGPPPIHASVTPVGSEAATAWVDRLPYRWTRNGGIIGALWCLPFLALQLGEKDDPSPAIVGVLLVGGLVGGLACLAGMGAKRRLRRILHLGLDDALTSLRKIPREFAVGGAGIGVVLAALIGDWQGRFQSLDTPGGIAHNIGYLLGGALTVSIIGAIVGLVARSGLRKRLTTTGAISIPTAAANSGCETQPDEPAIRFNNFIARYWRGEFSLPVSYWVFGFVGNLFVGLIAVLISGSLTDNRGYEPRAIFASFFLIWFCVLAVGVWQLVGVWRSAKRYRLDRVRSGKQAFWAGAAQLAVVLGFLQLFLAFSNTGMPQVTELYRMAFLDDPDMPPYSIRLMRNGTETEITGGFKYGLTDDLIRILRASPQVRVVHLDSIGGRIGEAKKLYKLIRDRGLITYVSKECHSACTVAFAAGRERWLRNGAVLGFHSPAFPGMSDLDLAESVRDQRDLLLKAGFESAFVERALATPNNDMWVPTSSELFGAKVITGLSDGSHFAVSGFGAEVSREDMATKLSNALPALETLKQRLPDEYSSIVNGFYDGYLNGQTENEIIGAARDKLVPLLATYRPLADDDVLVDLAKLTAEQYAALGVKDPRLCYLYASGTDTTRNFSADIPASLVRREAEITKRVIATASSRPRVAEKTTAALWEKVFRQLAKRFRPDKLAILESENPSPGQYRDYCALMVALFEEIYTLTRTEAGLLMRDLWSQKQSGPPKH